MRTSRRRPCPTASFWAAAACTPSCLGSSRLLCRLAKLLTCLPFIVFVVMMVFTSQKQDKKIKEPSNFCGSISTEREDGMRESKAMAGALKLV